AALADADAADLNARFRTCGLDTSEPYAVISATVTPAPPTFGDPEDHDSSKPPRTSVEDRDPSKPPRTSAPSGSGAAGTPPRTSATFRPGAAGDREPTSGAGGEEAGGLGGQVLEELLGREVVAAPGGGGAVAVVPLRELDVTDLADRLRAGAGVLSAAPDVRVCLGLSGALTGAAALRGGVE